MLRTRATIVDVGCGCGSLARTILDQCAARKQSLVLIDSAEMLSHLPNAEHVIKVAGQFPYDCAEAISALDAKCDAVIVYSVLQYVFRESPLVDFVDSCLRLLAPGGSLLIGDIPNRSLALRNTGSTRGDDGMDDSVVLALQARCRAAGFDAYLLPLSAELPLARMREDLLVRRRGQPRIR